MNAPIPPRRSQGQWCANCRLFLPELPQAFGQTATLVKTVAPTEVDAFLAIDPRVTSRPPEAATHPGLHKSYVQVMEMRDREKADKDRWIRDSCAWILDTTEYLRRTGQATGKKLTPAERQAHFDDCVKEGSGTKK